MIHCVGRKWNTKVTYFVWTNIFFFVAVLLVRIFLRSKQCRLSHSIYWNYDIFTLNLLNPCLSQPLSPLNSCSEALICICICICENLDLCRIYIWLTFVFSKAECGWDFRVGSTKNWKFFMTVAMRCRIPPLTSNGTFFRPILPHFSFAIESYIYLNGS